MLEDVRQAINNLPPSPTRQALLSLVADTQNDLDEFQSKVEGWFNDSMDRASGWYKHRSQNILLAIALVLTALLNVDTIKLAQSLWTNPIERQATVDLASKYVDQHKDRLQDQQALRTQAKDLNGLGQQLPFPLGWQNWKSWTTLKQEVEEKRQEAKRQQQQAEQQHQAISQELPAGPPSFIVFYGETAIGWLITTLALSLGAPFWFDTLNKFMVVRSTVKPKEKTEGRRARGEIESESGDASAAGPSSIRQTNRTLRARLINRLHTMPIPRPMAFARCRSRREDVNRRDASRPATRDDSVQPRTEPQAESSVGWSMNAPGPGRDRLGLA